MTTMDEGLRLLEGLSCTEAMSVPASSALPSLGRSTATQLNQWLTDSARSCPIFWISGMATSSSVRDISDICQQNNRLGALYSFSKRKGAEQMRQLIPTLAWQLSRHVPQAASAISHAICSDRSLHSKALHTQFHALILEPFQHLSLHHSALPVVLIDGLELYHDEATQAEILSIIELAVLAVRLPLLFLFTNYEGPSLFYGPPLHPDSYVFVNMKSTSRGTFTDNKKCRLGSQGSRGFPRLLGLHHVFGLAESYTRSLMMLGHGFPLLKPSVDRYRPANYRKRGVSIGDVISIAPNGSFKFRFNIFLAKDDPAHAYMPYEDFRPIQQGLDSGDTVVQDDFFPPGTVLTSHGVVVTKKERGPLTVQLESHQQEGGVIILPNGASRSDLVSTEHLHEYIRKFAAYWYDAYKAANGSLLLVTGCDKASEWAIAAFPRSPVAPGRQSQITTMRYTWRPNFEDPWDSSSTYLRHHHRPERIDGEDSTGWTNQCIFVRGIHISVGDAPWSIITPFYHVVPEYAYTNILQDAPTGSVMTNVLAGLRLRMTEQKALECLPHQSKHLFHPNIILGQVLLDKHPRAIVALVDDAVWCSLIQGYKTGTLNEMKDLIAKVMRHHDIVEKDGVVTLRKKATATRSVYLGAVLNIHKWFKLTPVGVYAKQFDY